MLAIIGVLINEIDEIYEIYEIDKYMTYCLALS